MNIQIQIIQIENGFLVASPPGSVEQNEALRKGFQPQPITHHCKDYDDVVQYLKEVWPLRIK